MESATMQGYVIGVDVGTASARAGLFDLQGKRLAIAAEPIQIHRPLPEYAEQSSEDIWRAVCKVVRQVVSEARVASDAILGIGYDATCSLVVLDTDDKPLSISPTGEPRWNIIMWMDHRAIAETEQANAGGYEALRYSGGALSPEMEPPKLAWLRNHLPQTFEGAGKFLDLADFLVYRSTGNNLRSECTMGCKWTYLPAEKRWDTALLRDLGIESILERGRAGEAILPLGSAAGNLTPQSAQELGLSTNTKVATGIVDAHAGTIGLLGAVWAGQSQPDLNALEHAVALIAGTSSCLMALSQQPRFVQGVWGPYYGAVLPTLWMNEGGQSAAGALIDYTLEHHRQYPALELKAEREGVSIYEAANRIVDELTRNLPYPALLTRHLHVLPDHYGNRAPYADPHARGVVDGLTLDTSLNALATLYYATLQALAYNLRDVLRAMSEAGYQTDTIYVTGGSAKNRYWLRETADITGCRVVVNREPEAVLLGGAILGAVAAGAYPDIPHAMHAMTAPDVVIEPNPATYDYHAVKFSLFRELYQQHKARRAAMQSVCP
ncbi:MAG: FGGY-family carbohydrate kinase [Fimbriimonadales bacterium]|nr:FGGY-family carbohydrate kinase [Fimbriimonadales bacterium]